MKREKGFTLIELLAVIVILAVIALIATPIILNIVEKARKEAFRDTAYGIIDAAELQYTEGILDSKVEEKLFTFPQEGEDILKFSGGEPKGGEVKISNTGKVSIAIHNGDWCARKLEDSSEVVLTEYTGNCNLSMIEYTKEECFTFDESTGTITKYNKSNDACGTEVVIPEKINGVTVKAIGNYAFVQHTDQYFIADDEVKIVSVVLPSGLESIGDNAFLGARDVYEQVDEYTTSYAGISICNEISILDFSKVTNLKTIGASAFLANPLTDVQIPTTVTTVYKNSFPDAVMNRYNDNGFVLINNNLVDYTGTETYVMIPDGVISIGKQAFMSNQLTSVIIPNSVTSIEYYAFADNQLTSVVIPNSVTSIGNDAFYSNQLTSVTIKGKSSSANFTSYPSSTPFGWAKGYNNSNIIWEGSA